MPQLVDRRPVRSRHPPAGGHHHDRQVAGGLVAAQGAQDPEAVQARHADVEQHEAGCRLGPRRLERLLAVGRLAHLVAGPPQVTRCDVLVGAPGARRESGHVVRDERGGSGDGEGGADRPGLTRRQR